MCESMALINDCFQGKAVVLENNKVAEKTYFMKLLAPEIARKAKAGQFIKFRSWSTEPRFGGPLLDRPFSLHLIGPNDEIALLYRVVGVGTSLMASLKIEEEVELTGPLGLGLDIEIIKKLNYKAVYLVAGGVGVAPMAAVGAALKEQQIGSHLFYGERKPNYLIKSSLLKPYVSSLIKTVEKDEYQIENCFQGYPTMALKEMLLKQPRPIFACGPMPMLASVHQEATKAHVPAFVSLEARMACGFGVCFACALPKNDGTTLNVCHEGPVVDSTVINWDKINAC